MEIRRPEGRAGAMRVWSARSMPALTVRTSVLTCCERVMRAASRPLPVARVVRSGDPGKTWATSATRSVAPLRTAIGVAATSPTECQASEASTRYCRPPES